MERIKAALYVRVSRDGLNLENQLIPLKKWAEALGHIDYKVYSDVSSGGSSDRISFQKLMSDIKQRHINLILCVSLDRFSREGVTQTLFYIRQLREYKANLMTLNDNINTKDGGVFDVIISIFSYASALERQKISERTKAGLERARKDGKVLGRPKKKGGG